MSGLCPFWKEPQTNQASPNPESTSAQPEPSIPEPSCTPSPTPHRPTAPGPQTTTMSDEHPKMLFIGDSISANVDIAMVEKAINGRVETSRAYSSVFDNVGTRAKKASRYPAKNFKDIVPMEVKKEPYEYLLLQGGTVDITNHNTKDKPKELFNYYKQEVRFAAKICSLL